MPIINVEVTKLTKDQKRQLISELTGTLSQIAGTPEAAISVVIKENSPDNIGVAGRLLSETE